MPPMGEEENDEQESESEDESMPQLPAGGMFTVMMFGMTGAGKSAIGNLLAGCEAFASGDDTASVTNLDSAPWSPEVCCFVHAIWPFFVGQLDAWFSAGMSHAPCKYCRS